MKILKKLKEKRGFTLVESMVAIAILAIATTTFAVFLATTNRMTVLTLQNEEDYQVLQEFISTKGVGNYGTISVQEVTSVTGTEEGTTAKPSFTINLEGAEPVVVDGKYVVVSNSETGQSFVIFVGDKINANP